MKQNVGTYLVSQRAASDAAGIASDHGVRSAYLAFDRAVEERAAAIARAFKRTGMSMLGETSIAGGERCKRMSAVSRIHHDLAAAGADRATMLVAVGGGSVTDVSGFAAATYMRGIPWLPVATTVLGMVDASIGGKTGVDVPEGKNLIGAFWQPVGVVADLHALATLPLRERRTGMAEIVKHAIVGDPGLLRACAGFAVDSPRADWPSLIGRAAGVKLRIVRRDPYEAGERASLNLGHTIGHALEFASGYRIAHGAAVAVGLRGAGLLALEMGLWSAGEHARVLEALTHTGLAVHAGGISASALLAAMRRDKKRVGNKHRFVLPLRIGKVISGVEVDEPAIRRALTKCSRPASAGELRG
ncbi:MAG TPA: 3-dehydroquinate synthase family protein [Candidatus Eremiobacteraceae bacterium]|nr:3-dehydroquinate synthase family protein [Candidatus Eremiobacteraceae bacterium]